MPHINRYTPLADLTAVVLDTETTGLEVANARIVQIGAVRVEQGQIQPAETFLSLVNPGIPIPRTATAVHGIDNAAVQAAPPFATVKARLDDFLGNAVVVGQSIGFDLAILLRETRRIGSHWEPSHFLDTKLLYAVLSGDSREHSLDDLMAKLAVTIDHRHAALSDAWATAEIFIRLIPLLATKGIYTLGEAEARCNAQTGILERQAREGWFDATSVRPEEAWIAGRDRDALARLDPFLYRHRLRHVMKSPALFLPPHTTVEETARQMEAQRRGVVIVGDEKRAQVWGIVSERDLLLALARKGAAAAACRLESIMTESVISLPQEAFLYRALAKMQRAQIRHLAVTDAANRILGTLSVNSLLGERASQAILLGDEVSEANDAADLARARARLPLVARELLNNDVDSIDIARVLSFELRELIGRASVLAERTMKNAGAGRPPVPYALQLLGSGGRGEALLAAEQNIALVYESEDGAGVIQQWYSRFGEHLTQIVQESGVSRADSVDVRNPAWIGSLASWRERMHEWRQQPSHWPTAFAARIFDGHLAYGNAELDAEFHRVVREETRRNRALGMAIAQSALEYKRPAAEETEVDLKRSGLMPITAAMRALAVYHGIAAISTPERLAALGSVGAIGSAERDRLDDVQSRLLGWLIRQQIDDFEADRHPSKTLNIQNLSTLERESLQSCFEQIRMLPTMVRAGLGIRSS
ncbi:MAG: CBS domain-containing protein [Gammaproteobacteria bacterium]|nr:CBS domain-containing protein [Gammaproteobacteria bacterium]MCP5423597.1 CBS domain-containing protein [Gammaproteobacteria bacterium]MCP5459843.1 CBS domain-containing protein [Gammaproteobacteria bacterium]